MIYNNNNNSNNNNNNNNNQIVISNYNVAKFVIKHLRSYDDR